MGLTKKNVSIVVLLLILASAVAAVDSNCQKVGANGLCILCSPGKVAFNGNCIDSILHCL